MNTLLRSTAAYQTISHDVASRNASHTTLVLFPDERYLRALLKECAKAFFEGDRARDLIEKESYSDCLFFPAEGEKLNAECCARIADESALRPVEGEKKLFVLLLGDATPLVQNKLLKLLEEPPAGVYFLLGACAEHTLLPTVLSRAKKISVPPFSEEEIYAALNRKYPTEEGKRESAAACGGLLSTAEALLLGGGEDFLLAERFLLGEETSLFRSMEKRKEKKPFFAALKLVLRDAMFFASGNGKYCSRKTEGVARIAEMPVGVLVAAIGFCNEAEKEIAFNANAGQALYALSLKIQKEKERWQTSS